MRYIRQCNDGFLKHRGVRWTVRLPWPFVSPASLSQIMEVDPRHSLYSVSCTQCGANRICNRPKPLRPATQDPNQSASSGAQRIITFHSFEGTEPEFNTNFYLEVTTGNRITLDEVNYVLDGLCEVRRPFCKILKILHYLFMIIPIVSTVVYLYSSDQSNRDNYSPQDILDWLRNIIIFIFLTVITIRVYAFRRGRSTMRRYIEGQNTHLIGKGLRWHLPGKFIDSVDLCLDYSIEEDVMRPGVIEEFPVQDEDIQNNLMYTVGLERREQDKTALVRNDS